MPYYRHRVLCDVLGEMRTCVKTLNFAPMLSLIEEVQSMGNRMEAALGDQKHLVDLQDEIKKLKDQRKGLLRELGDDIHREAW